MNAVGWIRRTAAAAVRAAQRVIGRGVSAAVRGRYDAAQTTVKNQKHWSNADSLSAPASNTPAVRAILRNRARYEVANNGYLDGMRSTLANHTVGTGPRLQVRTADKATNDLLEAAWSRWAERIDLASKLRTMRMAKMVDGEVFGLLTTNARLAGPVKLDLRLVEADQIAAPDMLADPELQDGIRFDADGNPVAYFLLRAHPGDVLGLVGKAEYDEVQAEFVVHYFTPKRAGDRRAVPEITSTLSLGADGRRWRLATLEAAETAANFAMVVQTTAPESGAQLATPFEEYDIARGQMLVLPHGATLGQAKPEQPTTTSDQFNRLLMTETARPLCMPRGIATGDSSDYNYSSGRLDHQSFFKGVEVEQDRLRTTVLERLFEAWVREAALGLDELAIALRAALAAGDSPAHQWLWPGTEHVDPLKEAAAQQVRLLTNTTTLKAEYGRAGLDWEQELRQRAAEMKLMRELGIPTAAPTTAPDVGDDKSEEGEKESGDGDELDAAERKAWLDSIGLAVRSGLLTPQQADEIRVRAELRLPAMGADVRKAWQEKPTRAPVTLAQEGKANAPAAAGGETEETNAA